MDLDESLLEETLRYLHFGASSTVDPTTTQGRHLRLQAFLEALGERDGAAALRSQGLLRESRRAVDQLLASSAWTAEESRAVEQLRQEISGGREGAVFDVGEDWPRPQLSRRWGAGREGSREPLRALDALRNRGQNPGREPGIATEREAATMWLGGSSAAEASAAGAHARSCHTYPKEQGEVPGGHRERQAHGPGI
uniref:Uncharacterized protein n=1 Tax=Tetraselmis sp. GSL018 TaxID=582737 RepID=A0A061S3S4_9CHLO